MPRHNKPMQLTRISARKFFLSAAAVFYKLYNEVLPVRREKQLDLKNCHWPNVCSWLSSCKVELYR